MSLWAFFARKRKPKPLEGQKLGIRSPLVLAKIGHDLRQDYEAVLEEPLPDALRQVVERLPDTPTLQVIEGTPKGEEQPGPPRNRQRARTEPG